MLVGIIGAMPEEINGIVDLLSDKKISESGGRSYHEGTINDIRTVVVFSRWGKVAASITATYLINHFNITHLVFVGVAGAINNSLNIGDIVISKKLIQHDMDARPLMKQFEIPLLGVSYFKSDEFLVEKINMAANDFVRNLDPMGLPNEIGIVSPVIHVGNIASGDKFLSEQSEKSSLCESLPEVLCVEMEGAAVAQVCYEYSIPFVVVRTISDNAGEGSHLDFSVFVNGVAAIYGKGIISSFFRHLKV